VAPKGNHFAGGKKPRGSQEKKKMIRGTSLLRSVSPGKKGLKRNQRKEREDSQVDLTPQGKRLGSIVPDRKSGRPHAPIRGEVMNASG